MEENCLDTEITQSAKWFETVYMKMYHYITDLDMWVALGESIIKIIFIIVAARVTVRLVSGSVNRIFRQRGKVQINERRLETMKSLINNVTTYVTYFIALLWILAQLGFNLAPVLASAGVVGLAVGFGAQNLVRDVITGFFIIFEDQFAVGDYITTGKFSGTVQEIGLRITRIKSGTGEVHIIPNGRITEVTNFSIQNSMAVIDVSVAYEEDVHRVISVLTETLSNSWSGIEELEAPPEVLGVQHFGPSEVIIRVTAECKPMGHFSVSRELRALIKKTFDEKGIEIPFPRVVTVPRDQKVEV
jgi:moderate conductance mechanosensitive channel